MKTHTYILLVLFLGMFDAFGQESTSLNFKDLKKINCEGINEKSSQRKQQQCFMLDVVLDSLNYFPSMSRKNDSIVTSPEMAWNALRKLYPEYTQDKFVCWTEYAGYYCFSIDCGYVLKKKRKCYFICMFYIPIGGNEFWYFVPRT